MLGKESYSRVNGSKQQLNSFIIYNLDSIARVNERKKEEKKSEINKNVKKCAAEARSRAVWASRTQSRALTTELLELLLQLAKFRIDIDSYYILKLQLLFILSRDCHLLSYSNCCFHYRNTVTILDTLVLTEVGLSDLGT